MFNFWSILSTLLLGLFGMGQLHEYIVSGNVPANFEDAPKILRSIIETTDLNNARRLVEAASYADAAGQHAVIPGDIQKTVKYLAGLIESNRFEKSSVHVSVEGLTEAQCRRAARFLSFSGDHLVLKSEPASSVKWSKVESMTSTTQKPRVAFSRPLGTNAGFGI